ncbi:N-acetyltransferase [Mobilitalea sibirica]|uniref:N-acetyltransferase n=1 Tax=Mobilitalea sibirica TaxID=1462919 RepID=A0A8J7L2X0_9FIRM|nr:GNAT family N-acetyltransferase [Mobilitalea sibirica]MBH1941393.1 N-acetyltransferase [Mobilitalea sibirica]
MFEHEKNRIYMVDEDNQMLAVITFPTHSDNTVIIDHTYVSPSLRGQGIAGKLMEETVSHLRENNLKARLSCSYAREWFQRHPECNDVLDKN